jgi:NADPH:quinone reductase-like Zn-dependent oxidoreductase
VQASKVLSNVHLALNCVGGRDSLMLARTLATGGCMVTYGNLQFSKKLQLLFFRRHVQKTSGVSNQCVDIQGYFIARFLDVTMVRRRSPECR